MHCLLNVTFTGVFFKYLVFEIHIFHSNSLWSLLLFFKHWVAEYPNIGRHVLQNLNTYEKAPLCCWLYIKEWRHIFCLSTWSINYCRVAHEIVLLCQKSKSSKFKLIFPFQMNSYPTDSIFSPIRWCLGVAKSIFVFTK